MYQPEPETARLLNRASYVVGTVILFGTLTWCLVYVYGNDSMDSMILEDSTPTPPPNSQIPAPALRSQKLEALKQKQEPVIKVTKAKTKRKTTPTKRRPATKRRPRLKPLNLLDTKFVLLPEAMKIMANKSFEREIHEVQVMIADPKTNKIVQKVGKGPFKKRIKEVVRFIFEPLFKGEQFNEKEGLDLIINRVKLVQKTEPLVVPLAKTIVPMISNLPGKAHDTIAMLVKTKSTDGNPTAEEVDAAVKKFYADVKWFVEKAEGIKKQNPLLLSLAAALVPPKSTFFSYMDQVVDMAFENGFDSGLAEMKKKFKPIVDAADMVAQLDEAK